MNDIKRYQAAEFKSAMLRLGVAAMLGSETASQTLAGVSADVSVEHALNPNRPGVAERYRATIEATAMACFAPAPPPGQGRRPPAGGLVPWLT